MSDWDTATVIGKKRTGGGATDREKVVRGKQAANGALTGLTESQKKAFATSSKGADPEGQRTRAIADADGIVKPRTVGTDTGKAITKARTEQKNAKGQPMTQKDLAAKINEKPEVIAAYERGTAEPNQTVFNKLENTLKTHFRGKLIGQPKVFGKKNQAAA